MKKILLFIIFSINSGLDGAVITLMAGGLSDFISISDNFEKLKTIFLNFSRMYAKAVNAQNRQILA